MRYMIMMFGDAGGMFESKSEQWVREMIGFMVGLDKELHDAGELVFQAGLADGSMARTYSKEGGSVVATDGPFAESKESLIGFWVVDVAEESRLAELATRIVDYAEVVEVRQVMDAPPEL